MRHFSMCAEPAPSELPRVLSTLITMDRMYGRGYTCVISGNRSLKTYVEKFPYNFRGAIEVVEALEADVAGEPLYNTMMRSIDIMAHGVRTYGNTIHVSTHALHVNPMEIPDDIGDVGVVRRSIDAPAGKPAGAYHVDLVYLASMECCDYLSKLFKDLTDEAEKEFYERQAAAKADEPEPDPDVEVVVSFDDIDDEFNNLAPEVTAKYITLWRELPHRLVERFRIERFLPFNACVASEDYFTADKAVLWAETDCHFGVLPPVSEKEQEEQGEQGEQEQGEQEQREQEQRKRVNIMLIMPRLNAREPVVVELNQHIVRRQANRSSVHASLVHMHVAGTKLPLCVPREEGVGIWDRRTDPPGLRALFQLIASVHYGDYFAVFDSPADYYSFGGYALTDKPGMHWLTNQVALFGKLLICNHDASLLAIKDSLPIRSEFLCYYSDEPGKLEAYVETRSKQPKEPAAHEIVEFLSDGAVTAHDADGSVSTCSSVGWTFEERMDRIAEARFIAVESHDVNLVANALAVGTIPVFPNDLEIPGLEEGTHYVRQAAYSAGATKHGSMKKACRAYYHDCMSVRAVANKLLSHDLV